MLVNVSHRNYGTSLSCRPPLVYVCTIANQALRLTPFVLLKGQSLISHLNLISLFVFSGPEVSSSYSNSAMSETVVPDTMVSPAVGSLYGEKTAGPVVDFSYVGIDAILEQMRRKAMKQGFELNIMVVGKFGLFVLDY